MVNALTIDVEDWFCANNITISIGRENWEKCESRIERNIEIILNILDRYNTRATFFVLGWIAQRFPHIVKIIDKQGHEIATHGYSHTLLTAMTPNEFENELSKSLIILRELTDKAILGFRAPSFTITERTIWALKILTRYDIRYDSSVFPIGFHPDYGIENAPLCPYKIVDNLIEFPLSCVQIFGRRIPVSGGAYFRLLPYLLSKKGLKKINNENRPFVFYIHPWELDVNQPRINLPLTRKLRHYYNIEKTEKRFIRLINDFQFAPIKKVLNID